MARVTTTKRSPANGSTLGLEDYTGPRLDEQSLGGVIDLSSTIRLGDAESHGNDIFWRVYEYFLSEFASAEGKIRDPKCECRIPNGRSGRHSKFLIRHFPRFGVPSAANANYAWVRHFLHHLGRRRQENKNLVHCTV